MTNNLKGVLFALIGFASYSLMDGTIKFLLNSSGFSWQVLIFYTSSLVLVILFLTILLSKESTFRVKRPFWLLVRAAIGVSNLHIIFFILPKVHLDLFYSLVFVAPILASVMAAFFLGEHINIHKSISIIVGFMGILIITKPWAHFFTEEIFKPIELVPLLVALTDAAIGIIARKYLVNDKPVTLVFYQFALCTIVSASFVIFSFSGIPLLNTYSILPVIIIAIFAIGGYIFYIKAVQTAPVQIVLPIGYSQMVFGIIISIVLFSQYPKVNTIIGALVIIFASLYISLYASITKNKKGEQIYIKD